jgi:hypothetical protein
MDQFATTEQKLKKAVEYIGMLKSKVEEYAAANEQLNAAVDMISSEKQDAIKQLKELKLNYQALEQDNRSLDKTNQDLSKKNAELTNKVIALQEDAKKANDFGFAKTIQELTKQAVIEQKYFADILKKNQEELIKAMNASFADNTFKQAMTPIVPTTGSPKIGPVNKFPANLSPVKPDLTHVNQFTNSISAPPVQTTLLPAVPPKDLTSSTTSFSSTIKPVDDPDLEDSVNTQIHKILTPNDWLKMDPNASS